MAGGNTTFDLIPRLLLRAAAPFITGLRQRFGAVPLPLAGHVADLPVLQPGDAEAARQLYAGQFMAGGQDQGDLHGFSWLADLEAANLGLHRVFARKLLRSWQQAGPRNDFESVAARLLSFSRHGGFLLAGAGEDFRALLLAQVGADIRRLTQSKVRSADQAVTQSAAVLSAAICYAGPERLRDEASARLGAAAGAVILPDGGHISRAPARLLDTLELLVPLRRVMAAQHIEVPQALNAAVERALAALAMLCHGDGGLSLLQGGSSPHRQLVKALLGGEPSQGRPPHLARQSGFARLGLGATTVLVDCGPPANCAGMLSFEFSDGPQRIVGPCGVPPSATPEWLAAATCNAAQSGLELAAGTTAAINRFFGSRKPNARPVAGAVITSPHGMLFKGQAQPVPAALGLRHHRELFLSADGSDLRGEDRLERGDPLEGDWPAVPFAIRFHLHPDVSARSLSEDGPVVLGLPGGVTWQFSARGGNLSLEDSIFLATGEGPKKSRQIVIRGVAGKPDIVNWAFRRQATPIA